MTNNNERLNITPHTKIAALLAAYPQLESVLIGIAPVFRHLKNPVLRRTVAKVTSIEAAASIAKLDTQDLVRALRSAAGFEDLYHPDTSSEQDTASPKPPAQASATPEWCQEQYIVESINADALLDEGKVPLGLILQRAQTLEHSQILRIQSSFRPVPLLETLEKSGYPVFIRYNADKGYDTCIAAKRAEN